MSIVSRPRLPGSGPKLHRQYYPEVALTRHAQYHPEVALTRNVVCRLKYVSLRALKVMKPVLFLQFCDQLRSDEERRDFVAAGAASGVSAAFASPVGENDANVAQSRARY